MRHLFFSIGCIVLLAAACGDDDSTGDSGNTGATSSVGAAGPAGSGGTGADGGAGPGGSGATGGTEGGAGQGGAGQGGAGQGGAGGSGAASGGAGGGGNCVTCAEILNGGNPANACVDSATIYKALVDCYCTNCPDADECEASCAAAPAPPDQNCNKCIKDQCATELTDCSNDA